jgi:sugar lactone lactonase YvrE
MDNLPGPPDGLSRSSDGHYWVTVPAAFPPVVKLSQVRVARLLIAWMPRLMRLLRVPLPKMGLVLKLSPEGRIVQTLADPKGKVVDGVSSAVEHDGKLFLGTLKHQGVPVLDLASLHS